MGAEVSRLETDINAYNRNFSEEHKISAWVGMPPKNAEYYSGDRFFKIGKDKYRCYEKGWIYGHNYVATEEEGRKGKETTQLQEEIADIKRRVAALADHELAF